MRRALELTTACPHPDARFLTDLFSGKDVKTKEEARTAFFSKVEMTRSLFALQPCSLTKVGIAPGLPLGCFAPIGSAWLRVCSSLHGKANKTVLTAKECLRLPFALLLL